VQERRVGRGQGSDPQRFLFHLVQVHRQNETPRVVVRAIALGKIRHGKQGVLEEAGRVGHPRQVVQLQLGQRARLLVEGLGRKQLS